MREGVLMVFGKHGFSAAVIVTVISIAGVPRVQSATSWDSVHLGAIVGAGTNTTCISRSLSGGAIDPTIVTTFSNRICPDNTTFVGGVQIGDDFQYNRFVWGVGAEFDYWSAQNRIQELNYSGKVSPPGVYAISGRLNPSGFFILGPRIGYGGDHWMPYLRVGGVIITGASHDSTLTYTPTGSTKPTASFNGGKNFSSTGWVAGGGIDLVLSGPWSISAGYLHMTLGNGSNSTSTCAGTATACAAFSGVSLDSSHHGFTGNTFRIGISYWLGY
jgi:outer membrane immunogenic protein